MEKNALGIIQRIKEINELIKELEIRYLGKRKGAYYTRMKTMYDSRIEALIQRATNLGSGTVVKITTKSSIKVTSQLTRYGPTHIFYVGLTTTEAKILFALEYPGLELMDCQEIATKKLIPGK